MSRSATLIGLDGATFDVLDQLIEDGVMPNLRNLLSSGVRAELETIIPALTPPAWTSLMTGRSPGNHGIFDFLQFEHRDGKPQLRVADANDVSAETIWSIVGRQGLRSTVLNFPMTFPARGIVGNVVPGWVPWRHLRLACYPRSLYDRLTALPNFSARQLAMDMALEEKALEGCHQPEDYENWINLHIERERQWFEVLKLLVREDPAPLTAVLFDGVDKLQHFCWRFIDRNLFPQEPTAWESRVRKLCLDYYREIDRMIGEIAAMGDEDTSVFIASDHGFGATVEVFYLNAWLHEHGYLSWVEGDDVEQKHPETLGLGTMARRFYGVDWKKTKAYCPTPSSNGIFITPSDGNGVGVSPNDYEEFRRKLKSELLEFADETTGEPIVERIWTREEAFAGEHLSSAPDLTLRLRDSGLVSILPSDVLHKPRPEVAGTHRPTGVFVAAGPGIRQGVSIPKMSILDVAPVLLYSMGLAPTEKMEGQVPSELYGSSFREANPVKTQESAEAAAAVARSAGEADSQLEADVMRQLKALGYME